MRLNKIILLSRFLIIFALLSCLYCDKNNSNLKTASSNEAKETILNYINFLTKKDNTANYSLFQASSIRVDKQKNVYVLDCGNHRIMKYNKQGEFLNQIGSIGQGPGELLNPTDFDLDENNYVYVINTGNQRIEIFDDSGKYYNSFKIIIPFGQESGIAIGPYGNIYINSSGSDSLITVYSSKGDIIRKFGKIKEYNSPLETKIFNQCLIRFNLNKLKLICLFIAKPEIHVYDINGNLIMSKRIEGEEINLTTKQWEINKKSAPPNSVNWVKYFKGFDIFENGDFVVSLWAKNSFYLFSESIALKEKLIPAKSNRKIFNGRLTIFNNKTLLVINQFDNTISKYIFQD